MSPEPISMAIVVSSCDAYADLWRPFFHQLDRFWPVRPGPTYLVTNRLDPAIAGVVTIPVGSDVSWSDNLAAALARVQQEYVLLCLEDLILCGPVDGQRIASVLAWAAEHRPNHVRLNPSEPPYRRAAGPVGEVPPGAPYRTSTVLTLWKREVLASLLKSGETAWQFEIRGSARSDAVAGFYSAHAPCFPVVNGVIRGKWEPRAVGKLTALGAPLDLTARRIMTRREALRFRYVEARARLFKSVPWQWRRRIRDLALS